MKPIILCFTEFYCPGFRGGGPIRTIANMVSHLSNDFEFWIVTRDRDLASPLPYPNILIDEWCVVGQAKVFYASPKLLTLHGIKRILLSTNYDVMYLNGFFNYKTTIQPLLLRYLGLCRQTPVILAPRGEFSTGALALKSTKKQIYLTLVKWIRIYHNLIWQASSDFELKDIDITISRFSMSRRIIIAPDLLPSEKRYSTDDLSVYNNHALQGLKSRTSGPLRIVFLSRISPKKNLDYLLRVLSKVNHSADLSIYGPDEDRLYWALCMDLIKNLPVSITVRYHGEVKYENVANVFAEHDLFVFPTRGENFGHVIYEALSVGTSVIVSDQTPWLSDSHGALQVISLDQPDFWIAAIDLWASCDQDFFDNHRKAAIKYSIDYKENNKSVKQNLDLFRTALEN